MNTIRDVTNEIYKAFERTSSGSIMQTFVGSNTIASTRDFAGLLRPKAEVKIQRYFFISNAYDINFAVHSLYANFEDVHIKNYIWTMAQQNVLADIFTNITIFPKQVVLTFANRDDQKEGEPDIFKSSESKDVVGLSIYSKKVSEFISNYHIARLHKINPSTIHNAKTIMMNSNPLEYIVAVVYSIIKEISSHELFVSGDRKSQLGYAGIVGSLSNVLTPHQTKMYEGNSLLKKKFENSPDAFNDVDVLLFIPQISRKKLEAIFKLADTVCRRYSITGSVEFNTDFEICPIKTFVNVEKPRKICIHFIINETGLVRSLPPSKLVVCDRLRNNVELFHDKPLNLYYRDIKDITVKDLLEEPLGLRDLERQLTDKECSIRYWSLEDERMLQRCIKLDDKQVARLAVYAAKWSLVNFCRAFHIELTKEVSHMEIEGLLDHVVSKISSDTIDKDRIVKGDRDSVLRLIQQMIACSKKL